MDGLLELLAQSFRVFSRDARDENVLFAFDKFVRDAGDLRGRFACTKDDFGKTFTQSAVRVYESKAQIGYGRGLKGTQNFIASGFPSAEFLQQCQEEESGSRGKTLANGVRFEYFFAPRLSRANVVCGFIS